MKRKREIYSEMTHQELQHALPAMFRILFHFEKKSFLGSSFQIQSYGGRGQINASKVYERHRASEIQIQIPNRHIKQVSHLCHENDDMIVNSLFRFD